MRWAPAAVLFLLVACATGETYGRRDAGGATADAPTLPFDGGGLVDAGGLDARGLDARATDAPAVDARGLDARTVDGGLDAPSGGGLDPRLDTPPASAPPCSTPGASCSAPDGPGVCRFFSATEGRCESCTACGNLGDPCSDGTDCDILFACFEGTCTNICPLGTFYCGPVDDCLDVGHPEYGVCRP